MVVIVLEQTRAVLVSGDREITTDENPDAGRDESDTGIRDLGFTAESR